MKKNTQRLLFALYQAQDRPQLFAWSYDYLQTLFPDFSAGGLRSMMKKLTDDGWVQKTTINNRTFFSLTQLGKYQLYEFYPFLRPSRRRTSTLYVMILISPPASDPQFYKLRTLLSNYQAVKLSRGTYLLFNAGEETLQRDLLKNYNNAVIVFEVQRSVFGELQQLALDIPTADAVKNTLSGVSRKLTELLEKSEQQKSLTDSVKASLSSCFYQIEEIVGESMVVDYIHKMVGDEIRLTLVQWQTVTEQYFTD